MNYDKLTVGIDEQTNLTELINLGIKQFYAGYIPSEWSDIYGFQQSTNRRYIAKEQFTDMQKLSHAIDTIHKAGGTLSLAVNAPFQTAAMLEYTENLLSLCVSLGIDSAIVGSIGALQSAKRYDISLTVSTALCIYSKASAEFFAGNYSPKRIVLPRDIMLHEAEAIVRAMPNMEFELFLYGDTCRWSDGHCYVEHGYDSIDDGLPLCVHLKDTNILFDRPNPSFKQLLSKNSTDELSSTIYTAASLLDEMEIASDVANEQKLSTLKEAWRRYDLSAQLSQNKAALIRAKKLFANDKELAQRLGQISQTDIDSKAVFSKTDKTAIVRTAEFFDRFENIKGYKIPSRGRDAIKLLSYIQKPTGSHFSTALYR